MLTMAQQLKIIEQLNNKGEKYETKINFPHMMYKSTNVLSCYEMY